LNKGKQPVLGAFSPRANWKKYSTISGNGASMQHELEKLQLKTGFSAPFRGNRPNVLQFFQFSRANQADWTK